MTVRNYAEDPNDVLVDESTGKPLAGRRVTVHESKGGQPVLDLLSPIGAELPGYIVTDNAGRFPFQLNRPSPPANLYVQGPIIVGVTPKYYRVTSGEALDQLDQAAQTYAATGALVQDLKNDNATTRQMVVDSSADLTDILSQQDQISSNAVSVDELSMSVVLPSLANASATLQSITAAAIQTLWVAPFPCEIVSMSIIWEYANYPGNDVNYQIVKLYRQRGGTRVDIGQKTMRTEAGGGEPVVRRQPWKMSNAVWNTANAVMAADDQFQIGWDFVGTGAAMNFPMTITWKYRPL